MFYQTKSFGGEPITLDLDNPASWVRPFVEKGKVAYWSNRGGLLVELRLRFVSLFLLGDGNGHAQGVLALTPVDARELPEAVAAEGLKLVERRGEDDR